MIKKVLGAEKSNNPVQHQNDLKEVVYDFYGSKKFSDKQCASIYQNIYSNKDNQSYLQSLIDFEFDKYKLSDINNLLEYLANLIDIARYNSQNTYKVKQLLLDPKIISIVNPMKLSFVNFNISL